MDNKAFSTILKTIIEIDKDIFFEGPFRIIIICGVKVNVWTDQINEIDVLLTSPIVLEINSLKFHNNIIEDGFKKEDIFSDAIGNVYKTNEKNHFKEFTNKKRYIFLDKDIISSSSKVILNLFNKKEDKKDNRNHMNVFILYCEEEIRTSDLINNKEEKK